MKRWMTKQWHWPWRGSGSLFVLAGAFLLGGLLGCGYTNLLGSGSAAALSAYLSDYLTAVGQGDILPPMWPVLWKRLCLLLAAVLSGLTALGVLSAPILLGVEGFLLTYSVACFYRLLGMSGFLPGFILFGLPALLWVPAMFLLTDQGMVSSLALFRRGLGESRRPLPFTPDYWGRVVLCAGILTLCAVLEAVVIPGLLCSVVRGI